ncbi:hypothetical protein [Bacillus sp. BR_7a]|uniref:hypothetical protein n=1 Tax=Bacillus sp. BR_7a TaxID=3055775 RepID=UPI0036634660
MSKKIFRFLFVIVLGLGLFAPNSANAAVECYDSGVWDFAFGSKGDGKDESELQAICEGNLVASGSIKASRAGHGQSDAGTVRVTVFLMKEKRGFDEVIKEKEMTLTIGGSAKKLTINAGDVPLGNYYIKVETGKGGSSFQITGSGTFKSN